MGVHTMVQTRHYEMDRKEREELIQKIGIGQIKFKTDSMEKIPTQ